MQQCNGKLWGTICNGDVEIRSLTKNDLEAALDILDKSFFLKESVCNACEINLPENAQARNELRELSRITAEDGVSLVAKCTATGETIAVSFNKIQYVPEDANEEPFFLEFRNKQTKSPQALRLMDFMIEIDGATDVFELYQLNCVCEMMFLSTLPQWEGRGIGRSLAHFTIEMTRNLSQGIGVELLNSALYAKRPSAVTALFTSQFSQKVGKSQGFKEINSVKYTDYSYNGKTFDQSISPIHKTCQHVIMLL